MEYKKIKNFKNYYVGDDGHMYKDCGGNRGLKRLKGMPNSGGYRAIVMVENGHKERYLIHRLVAMYFVPNPENKQYVDHINTDRTDNRPENLRWVNPKENSNNPISKKRMVKTQRAINGIPLLCKKDGIEIRFKDQYIAGQFFKCDWRQLLSATKTNTKVFGFQVFRDKMDENLAS